MNRSRSVRLTRRVLPTLAGGISSLIRVYILVLPIPRYIATSSGRSYNFSAGSTVLCPKNSVSFQPLAKDIGTPGKYQKSLFL